MANDHPENDMGHLLYCGFVFMRFALLSCYKKSLRIIFGWTPRGHHGMHRGQMSWFFCSMYGFWVCNNLLYTSTTYALTLLFNRDKSGVFPVPNQKHILKTKRISFSNIKTSELQNRTMKSKRYSPETSIYVCGASDDEAAATHYHTRTY